MEKERLGEEGSDGPFWWFVAVLVFALFVTLFF